MQRFIPARPNDLPIQLCRILVTGNHAMQPVVIDKGCFCIADLMIDLELKPVCALRGLNGIILTGLAERQVSQLTILLHGCRDLISLADALQVLIIINAMKITVKIIGNLLRQIRVAVF